MLTDEDVTARTERAREAAANAGRELGLDVAEPRVLYNVFSVIVHLAPSPVIVRVPTVLPGSATPESRLADQKRELAVTTWLAGQGFPVVPPSPLVPCEPVTRDGFSMTFWQYVEQVEDAGELDAERITAELHRTLRDYPGELEFMSGLDPFIPYCLTMLDGLLEPADVDRARREWAVLEPLFASEEAFTERFPHATVQPIHGDSPDYNLIVTPDGPLCSDFELVMRGPVEWDRVFSQSQRIYNAHAPRPIDEHLLSVMNALRMLQVVCCMAMVPDMPSLADGLKPAIEQWRTSMPFAGELI